jgi:uncharacterized protein (DUF4415 family)
MSKPDKKQSDEIEQLSKLPDNEIDTSDIPEVVDWNGAEVGRFYRPVKKQVTLRLDADMLEWFRGQGKKYQTRINQALREYMEQHRKAG